MSARKNFFSGRRYLFSVAFILWTTARAWAQPPTIVEYSVPTAGASLRSIVSGPDGNLWFTETLVNKIGKITPDGMVTEYSLPTPNSSPAIIIVGPDQNLWFNRSVNGNGAIGKITPDGTITEYRLPNPTAVRALAAGPDGNIWFTGTYKIGVITPAGAVTEYPVSSSCCPDPVGITAARDGNLWFTEDIGSGFSRLGKISTTGAVTELFSSSELGGPIILGPDENLWCGGISKITLAGVVTRYPVDGTAGMVRGRDLNIWFTQPGANRIGRITTTGSVTTYPLPVESSAPTGITIGPDGNVWFIEQGSNKIAKLVLPAPAGELAQIASGGGWNTNLTLVNLGPTPAEASISFFSDPDGVPLSLPIAYSDGFHDPINSPNVSQTLNPDAFVVLDTTSDKQIPDVGWSLLQTVGNVSGFATFSYPQANWGAVVPLENRSAESYTLIFDNTATISTGAAIANLSSEEITVFIALRSDAGTVIGSDTIKLPPHGHTAFMLDQKYSITAGKRGSVQIDSSAAGQISVLGLRINGRALTTVPVLALRGPALFNVVPVSGSIAHATYDGGFTSSFYIFNPGLFNGQFTLSFFDQGGRPLAVPLSLPQSGTSVTASVLTRTIAARAVLLIETISDSALPSKAGSAQLTSSGGLTGFEIFKWTTFGQEASVPVAAANSSDFVLVADNTNGVATGVALANTTTSQVIVTMNLRDSNGGLLQTAAITLPPRGQTSFMLPENYPVMAGKRGTAEFVISGSGISVIGLRLKSDGTLTTIPTLAK